MLLRSLHKFSLLLPAIPVPFVELAEGNVEDPAELDVLGLGPDVVVCFKFIFKHPHLLLRELPALFLLVKAVVEVFSISSVDYLIHDLVETDYLVLIKAAGIL